MTFEKQTSAPPPWSPPTQPSWEEQDFEEGEVMSEFALAWEEKNKTKHLQGVSRV